jgi:hypothetical protein
VEVVEVLEIDGVTKLTERQDIKTPKVRNGEHNQATGRQNLVAFLAQKKDVPILQNLLPRRCRLSGSTAVSIALSMVSIPLRLQLSAKYGAGSTAITRENSCEFAMSSQKVPNPAPTSRNVFRPDAVTFADLIDSREARAIEVFSSSRFCGGVNVIVPVLVVAGF